MIRTIVSKLTYRATTYIRLLFPYAVVMTVFFILLDTKIYPGFSKKIILIPTNILIFLVLGLGFYNLLAKDQKVSVDLNTIVFYINRLLTPAIFFFYFLLSMTEQQNYPNYIFSTYKMHVYPFKQLLTLMLGLIFVDAARAYQLQVRAFVVSRLFEKRISWRSIRWEVAAIGLIACFVFFTILRNTMEVFDTIFKTYPQIVTHPLASYEEKSQFILNDYRFFLFLKEYSSENAVIAIPPQQTPWLTSGNGGYVRYFTYPKHVINSPLEGSIPPEATHVMISKGEWPVSEDEYGWPKQVIEARRIWYFNRETNEVTLSPSTTYYPEENKYSWGLIELEQ